MITHSETLRVDHPLMERLRFANSYNRAAALLDLYEADVIDRDAWFGLAGGEWSSCDNLSQHRTDFREILQRASTVELRRMMTQEEQARHDALPKILTVYRGCYSHNRPGLSWSLSREIAEGFPRMNRYRHAGKQPLLRIGRVSKSRAVLKLDRAEQEIIAARVHVLSEEEI